MEPNNPMTETNQFIKSLNRVTIKRATQKTGAKKPDPHPKRKQRWLELVSKELNHLAAILHVYAGGLNFMK